MEQESDGAAAIVCEDPLVTLSIRTARTPMGLVAARPERFASRKGLHLIALSEPVEDDGRQTRIARDAQAAKAALPESRVVLVTNTEFEAYLLSPLGFPVFACSSQIFLNEGIFKPDDGAAANEAVVARSPQHEALLADVKELVLAGEGDDAARAERINSARVGICLSPTHARAAVEYLLCGLPVVATKAVGAAGRYLLPPFCKLVPAEPQAVAFSVHALAEARIPKAAVRSHILHLLRMERHNFLIVANKLAKETFGKTALFASVEPFARAWRAQ